MKHDKEYWNDKVWLKNLCLDSVKDLALKIGLNEYDTELLISLNRNETKIATCCQLGISDAKYVRDLKRIFNKINDYKKRNN